MPAVPPSRRAAMRGCRPRALLCGLLAAAVAVAAGGGRALPHLSDDVPFRVNWPGTEFSLVGALRGRDGLWGGKRGEHSPPGSPQPGLCLPGCPGPPPRSAVLLPGWESFKSLSGSRVICVFVCFKPTTGVLYKEDNYIIMTTVDKEKYKCILPLIASGNEVSSALFVIINCRHVLAASV